MTDHLFCDYGDGAVCFSCGFDDFPIYFGCIGRDAAINFAVEIFHDLGPAFFPPRVGRGHLFAVFQKQRVGKVGIGVCFGFVSVLVVRRLGIHAVGAAAEGGDVEKVHHALMVLIGGEV